MPNNGWIKIHRKITDNSLWFMERFTKAQAWLDLLLNANHKENIISIRGNLVKVGRGQIGWSELTMAKRWTWSKNKVRRFLKWLETEQQIKQQKMHKLTTITTIVNYEKYQNDTTDDTTERQQKDYRRYTNKNDKNEKNVKNEKKEEREIYTPTEVSKKVLEQYNKVFRKSLLSSVSFEKNLSFWLQHYSIEEILKAIALAPRHRFWADKLTPEILFRRKGTNGEDTDRISEMLSLESRPKVNNYDKFGNRLRGDPL